MSYRFIWQAFADREAFAEPMRHLGSDLLMLQREQITESVVAAMQREERS